MLQRTKELLGYTVQAQREPIGHVDDLLFDADTWVIRYLVVNAEAWLPDRRIIISPTAALLPDAKDRHLPVNLTKEQIENSPPITTQQPISRKQEVALVEYFEWPTYWNDVTPIDADRAGIDPATYLDAMRQAQMDQEVEEGVLQTKIIEEQLGDPQLHSINKLLNFTLRSQDHQPVYIEDFLVDDERWLIRYLVADIRDLVPMKMVLVPIQWVKRVDWANLEILTDLTREVFEGCPAYDAASPVTKDNEVRVYDYYAQVA
jgi:hypothetical protein